MLESHPLPTPLLQLCADPIGANADVLIVGLSQKSEMSATLAAVDSAGEGWIGRLIESGKLSGKKGELTLVASPASCGAAMVLLVGLGESADITRDSIFNAAASAIRKVTDQQHDRIVVALAESCGDEFHDVIVSGSLFACEGEAIYRSEPTIKVPGAIEFSGLGQAAIDRGQIIGQSMNHTRRLVNEPAGIIFPESFAQRAVTIGAEVGLEVEVWDHEKLKAEGCRAMLAVGQASTKPPRLVMLRHNGGGDEAPIAIVGKGVTFDSGGLSLKTSEGMKTMKCDMAGAATVVGVMHALAKLGVKKNVIGFCGLAENMVGGDSYKLGDVIETRSGKTIEILNTDAEGRVVLADTLNVTIGHNVTVTDSVVGDDSLIGIGSVLAPGTIVENDVLLAAGARTAPGQVLTAGHVWAGAPAKILTEMDDRKRAIVALTIPMYVEYADTFMHEEHVPLVR